MLLAIIVNPFDGKPRVSPEPISNPQPVGVGVGLGEAVAVAVGVGEAVGVGVGLDAAAQYLPPVLVNWPGIIPPQTIIFISLSVHTAVGA